MCLRKQILRVYQKLHISRVNQGRIYEVSKIKICSKEHLKSSKYFKLEKNKEICLYNLARGLNLKILAISAEIPYLERV